MGMIRDNGSSESYTKSSTGLMLQIRPSRDGIYFRTASTIARIPATAARTALRIFTQL